MALTSGRPSSVAISGARSASRKGLTLVIAGRECFKGTRAIMCAFLVSYREAPLATVVATSGAISAPWRRSPRNCRASAASPWRGNSFTL